MVRRWSASASSGVPSSSLSGTPEEVFDDGDDSGSVDATDREADTFSQDELCVPVNIDPVLWYDIVGDCDYVSVRQSVIERDWLVVSDGVELLYVPVPADVVLESQVRGSYYVAFPRRGVLSSERSRMHP